MLACLTIYFVNVSPLNVKLTSLSYVHQYIFLSSTTYTVAIVFKFREMLLTGNRRNRALFTRKKYKILVASQTVATVRIAPKICQGQPQTMYSECSRFHQNRFTFGAVIAERVNTAKLPYGVNPILARSKQLVHKYTVFNCRPLE